MPATLRPVGMLKSYIGGQDEAAVEAGRNVRETLQALGIPPELVALVMVNDQHQDKDYVVQDGDAIKVVAIIGGGG